MTPATLAEQAAAAEWAALRADARALDTRRQALGCTLVALAQRIGVSATTVGRMLRDSATTTPADDPGRRRLRQRLAALRLALDALQTQPTPTIPLRHATRPRQPRATAKIASVAVAALPQAPTYRVLIVEDDPDVVAIYRLTLAEAANDDAERAARYDVTVVATAAACLAALHAAQAEARPYDLLLMDLSLRDMRVGQSHAGDKNPGKAVAVDPDLLTALTRLSALLPRRRLVVSGIAPYHLKRVRHELASLGAAYLPKPFDIETLLATVHALCADDKTRTLSLTYFG